MFYYIIDINMSKSANKSKETLQKRIAFTTQKQYLADGPFRGAFAAYDNERGEVLIKKTDQVSILFQ